MSRSRNCRRRRGLRLSVGGLVEDEIRVRRAVVLVAHLRKQARAEAGAFDRLQILLGDDHVGVDIVDRQRRGDAGQCGEFVHSSEALLKRWHCIYQKPGAAANACRLGAEHDPLDRDRRADDRPRRVSEKTGAGSTPARCPAAPLPLSRPMATGSASSICQFSY